LEDSWRAYLKMTATDHITLAQEKRIPRPNWARSGGSSKKSKSTAGSNALLMKKFKDIIRPTDMAEGGDGE
jgi:hypothetical protein